MEILLADAPRPPPPIAVDAMPDAHDAAEAFEIEMQQIADVRPLVALHRRRRLEPRPRDSGRARANTRVTVERGTPERRG